MNRKWLVRIGITVVLLIFWLTGSKIVLGGAPAVSLAPAQPLSGVVAQSLVTGQSIKTLPVPDKDFTLQDVRYFDNDTWVVARVVPLHHNFDTSTVVLEKIQGAYRVVLGPSNSFDSSYLISLPTDVGQYLTRQGVIYVPAE